METKNMRKLEDEVFALCEGELPTGLVPQAGTLESDRVEPNKSGGLSLLTNVAVDEKTNYKITVCGEANIVDFLRYMSSSSSAHLQGKEVIVYLKGKDTYAIRRCISREEREYAKEQEKFAKSLRTL